MENAKQVKCKCPYLKCKRHGDCKRCIANHKWMKPYCKRLDNSLGKRIADKMFGASNKQAE